MFPMKITLPALSVGAMFAGGEQDNGETLPRLLLNSG